MAGPRAGNDPAYFGQTGDTSGNGQILALRFAKREVHQYAAITSISTLTPRGSPAAAIVVRAGGLDPR